MPYTKGIRKIFSASYAALPGMEFVKVADIAYRSGYRSLEFNGEIFVYDFNASEWIQTPFNISDFQTGDD